jgi:predicted nucleic acid-binding protein
VKLVVPEAESNALARELERWDEWVSCTVSHTEVVRAVRLVTRGPTSGHLVDQAVAVLARIALLDMDIPLLREAGKLEPLELRSLDAIHLAAARSLGEESCAMFTYDQRLARAATSHGLEVVSPEP